MFQFFDPGEVLYLYESPAGYGLVILRILAWTLFIYATVFTLKHYPEKSAFYYPFNLIGTMWYDHLIKNIYYEYFFIFIFIHYNKSSEFYAH